jgi:hypothetical protein
MDRSYSIRKKILSSSRHNCKTANTSHSRVRLSKMWRQSAAIVTNRSKIIKKIKEVWQLVGSVHVEISQVAIIKYLKNIMKTKGYHFTEEIVELLQT